MKKVPLTLWVSPRTKNEIRKRARKAHQKMSEVGREVLEAFLKVK